MINSVTVTNYIGENLTMGIGTPDESGLLISNIDGIGAGDVVINTTDSAIIDGSTYNSSRKPERDIVISMYLLWTPMVEDSRHLTYRYFPLKKKVKLEFETDRRKVWIEGYVKANEADIFNENETAQISIVCPFPWFQTKTYSTASFSGVEPMFEFPFSNESLEENLLIMSEIRDSIESRILYEGEVDTGCIIKIHARGGVGNLNISNTSTEEIMKLNTTKIFDMVESSGAIYDEGLQDSKREYIQDHDYNTIMGFSVRYDDYEIVPLPIEDANGRTLLDNKGYDILGAYGLGIAEGDTLIISTFPGEKKILLERKGVLINVLNCLDTAYQWIHLQRGYNNIAVTTDFGLENIDVEVSYPVLYEGV